MIAITDGFILVLAALYFLDTEGLLPLFLGAAILHELGHFIVLTVCRGKFERLILTAAGGRMDCRLPESRIGRILTLAAGPAVNLLLWLFFHGTPYHLFAGANLLLGLFNLMPIRPLDGGEILDTLCGGQAILTYLSAAGAAAVAFLGLVVWQMGGGVSMLLLGVMLSFLAGRSCTSGRSML